MIDQIRAEVKQQYSINGNAGWTVEVLDDYFLARKGGLTKEQAKELVRRINQEPVECPGIKCEWRETRMALCNECLRYPYLKDNLKLVKGMGNEET